jgi:hypothetical protein
MKITLQLLSIIVCSSSLLWAQPNVVIDLGGVVAGQNGRGSYLAGNEGRTGLRADTGEFTTGWNFGHLGGGGNNQFRLVGGSPLIDGVFILYGSQITSTGLTYSVNPEDRSGETFDFIRNNRIPAYENTPLSHSGKTYTSGIGMCSGQGITFDLQALKQSVGRTKALTFESDFFNMGWGPARAYVIVANETTVLSQLITPLVTDSTPAQKIKIDLPDNARFLTLIVGTNGQLDSDHTAFGDARIVVYPTGKLLLQKTSDLKSYWQTVPITSDMLSADGGIDIGGLSSDSYYRLRIETSTP